MKRLIPLFFIFFVHLFSFGQITTISQMLKLYENDDLAFRDSYLEARGFTVVAHGDEVETKVLGTEWKNKAADQFVYIKTDDLNDDFVEMTTATRSYYDNFVASAKANGYVSIKSYTNKYGELVFVYSKGDYYVVFTKFTDKPTNKSAYSVELTKTLKEEYGN